MSLNTIKVPSLEQLGEVASELGLALPEADLAAHHNSLLGAFEAYNRLDRMPDELPPVTYPRLPGRRPSPEENRYGAWYVKTEVAGAAAGKLRGKTVALKDNICLAGVPMMNGASTMEGYVPDVDATVAIAHPRRRRHDRRQDRVRIFLLFGRQPYQRHRPGAQPAPHGIFGWRLVIGQRGRGRCGRGANGIGRRPGRLDPHPGVVLRHLWHEADPWARALHRHHADRADIGPHRPDDLDGRGQCAVAGGIGRTRRARPAAIRRRGKALSRGVGQGRRGAENRSGRRRLRPLAIHAAGRCRRSRGGNAVQRIGRHGRHTCRSRCTATARRFGWRLPPRVP